jgi:hypothetical protein
MLRRFEDVEDPDSLAMLLNTALILPGAESDDEIISQLAARLESHLSTLSFRSVFEYSLALMHYRRNKYRQAERLLHSEGDLGCWYFLLAAIHARLGRSPIDDLYKGEASATSSHAYQWKDRVIHELLREEAQREIEKADLLMARYLGVHPKK